MEWLVVIALGFTAAWVFFNANVFWRNRSRSDVGHAVKSLLILLEDGGQLSITVRSSPIKLQMVRDKSVGTGARLVLRIPADDWSQPAERRLRALCDAHSYDYRFGAVLEDGVLCEIRLAVDDVWSPDVGASGSRLTNLVLDALGVGPDVRLKLDLIGPRSRRLIERERELRESENRDLA